MPILINEPFVGGNHSFKIFEQGVQTLNVMWTRCEQGIMRNHAQARDPQTQLEAVVVQIFGSTVAKIGFGLATAVSSGSGQDTHRQRQCINDLDWVTRLST